MNGDVWKTPHGLIGAEVNRYQIGRHVLVAVVTRDDSVSPFDSFRRAVYPLDELVYERARYAGARGGRGVRMPRPSEDMQDIMRAMGIDCDKWSVCP